VRRKILIPIDEANELTEAAAAAAGDIKDPEQELQEAREKIRQLESVLHYGVEMQKMVPRFEHMLLEAKVEELKFETARVKMEAEQKVAQAEEKMQAAVMLLDLPQRLQFMEPTSDSSYRTLSERWRETLDENLRLKEVLRNLRETAERLRVPIDEELLDY